MLERPGQCGDSKELRGLHNQRTASRLAHQLTHVGGMLTKIGVLFGPRLTDLSNSDKELVAKFSKKELDIQNV